MYYHVLLLGKAGQTALMYAVSTKTLKTMKLLLQRRDLLVNIEDDNGATALIIAVQKKSRDAVRELFTRPDLDVNKKTRTAIIPNKLHMSSCLLRLVNIVLFTHECNNVCLDMVFRFWKHGVDDRGWLEQYRHGYGIAQKRRH